MTVTDWIALSGVLAVVLGGQYGLLRGSILNQVDAKIGAAISDLNKAKIEEQNKMIAHLIERNENLKDQVRNTK